MELAFSRDIWLKTNKRHGFLTYTVDNMEFYLIIKKNNMEF